MAYVLLGIIILIVAVIGYITLTTALASITVIGVWVRTLFDKSPTKRAYRLKLKELARNPTSVEICSDVIKLGREYFARDCQENENRPDVDKFIVVDIMRACRGNPPKNVIIENEKSSDSEKLVAFFDTYFGGNKK